MYGRTPPFPHYYIIWGGYLSIKMLLYIAMTHAMAYPSPLTITSYRGGTCQSKCNYI